MSKVTCIVGNGNGGFYSCLIEPQRVSKETSQTNTLIPSFSSLFLNHLEPQSSKTKFLLPMLWDNLCQNSCILNVLQRVGKSLPLCAYPRIHFHLYQTYYRGEVSLCCYVSAYPRSHLFQESTFHYGRVLLLPVGRLREAVAL